MSDSANQWSVKYRPTTLKNYIAPQRIKTMAQHIIDNRSAHAILIHGPSGTGKTTLGRIIARGINGEHYRENLDERNLVKDSKVEDMRNMLDTCHYLPTNDGVRVYLLDEVHGLTKQAESALLKTLEEPPHNQVMFILCTDKPYKLDPTIQNRCRAIRVELPEPKELAQYLYKIVRANKAFPGIDDGEVKKAMVRLAKVSQLVPRAAVQNLQSLVESNPSSFDDMTEYLTVIADNAADAADKAADAILLAYFKSKNRGEMVNQIMKVYANVEPMALLHTMLWRMYALMLLATAGKFNYGIKDLANAIKSGRAPSVEDMSYVMRELGTLRNVRLREMTVDPSYIILPALLDIAFNLAEE